VDGTQHTEHTDRPEQGLQGPPGDEAAVQAVLGWPQA
jgi:hypothetical protein